MIVVRQKFLLEIFNELPKFCPEPHWGSGRTRTELCSGTGLHFAFSSRGGSPPEEGRPAYRQAGSFGGDFCILHFEF